MSKVDVTYRRPLNAEQVRVLGLLYWYRFCTAKQLAWFLEKSSHKAIQSKLQILEEQGLIGKRYDKTYKLLGRPAEYYATPKGARQYEKLKPNTTNAWAIKSLYKNKTVSQDFLTHSVNVTETALMLRAVYSEKLERFTKSYMVKYGNYPTWPPDLYLTLPTTSAKQPKRYFLDVWDGTKPFFISVRKTRNYANFKDSGDWLEEQAFPVILAVCEDERAQKKLNRQMKRILSDAWDDELVLATTTKQELAAGTNPTDKIWLKIDADDEPTKATLSSLVVTS